MPDSILLAAALTLTANFEGGSLGKVDQVSPTHLRCAVKGQADQNSRNRQANWYYFRLDNAPQNQELRIDLTDLVGEYNFRPGSHAVTKNTRPVYSYDNRTWRHFTDAQTEWNESAVELTLRFRPQKPTVWIAHMEPYLQADLDRLLALRHPHLRNSTVAKSAHGRAINLLTITDPASTDPGKKVIWLMARQHAWEAGTSWVADGAARWLLSNGAKAAQLRRSHIFHIMPIFDVDGTAEGSVRFNANGYDNNRNWGTADPASMPEIHAISKLLLDAPRIDLFLALHDTESVDYVEGPFGMGLPAIDSIANTLVTQLRETTSFHDPASPRSIQTRGPVEKGRMTVNYYLFHEKQIPAFLMELMVESHPKLNRPRTREDFAALGAGLIQALSDAASSAQAE